MGQRKKEAAPFKEEAGTNAPSTSSEGSSSAAALASGLKYLVASQVATRAITFALNLLTTRLLSVDAYGVAAVQFHLINTTILLLAREGIRRGCITGQQQLGERKKKDTKGGGENEGEEGGKEEKKPSGATLKLAATAALSFPAGCLVAALLVAPFFLRGVPARSPHRTAVRVQVAAALVELAAEPFYVVAAARGELAPRVAGEAGGTLVRGVLSLSLLRFFAPARIDPGVALSLAQLGYALTWLLAHLVPFSGEVASEARAWWRRKKRSKEEKSKKSKKASPPSPSDSNDSSLFLDRRALSLCGGFSLQAAEKLALAEGSRAVLAAAASRAAQGEFGLAANVGSLAVRTLFQPVEEAAFLAFARKSGGSGGGGNGDEQGEEKKKATTATRTAKKKSAEEDNNNEIEKANALLSLLCRCVTLVGATGAAFGPPFAFALVRFAYGKQWACETAAPRALGAYAAYTALLALNGVLEAFVHARGGPRELARGNAALLALAAFGAAAGAVGARRFGSVGLVAADAVTMAARIAWSLGAVGRLSREGRGSVGGGNDKSRRKPVSSSSPSSSPRLRDLLPSGATLAALALASCLGFASDAFFFGEAARGVQNSSSSSHLFRCSLDGRRLLAATAAHASVGALALAGVALVALRKEKETIAGVRALRSGRTAAGAPAKAAQD